MGQLFVVRHGQASIRSSNYDQLSELGARQARALGDYWLSLDLHWNRVVIGPRHRHRQTCEIVAKAYREAGIAFPDAETWEAFDEHAGPGVVKRLLSGDTDDGVVPISARSADAGQLKAYFRRYQEITRQWVRGEIHAPNVEAFSTFRSRLGAGLDRLATECRGMNAAIFTSGGPVAAAAGHALGLDDERTLELSWTVRNAAFSECLFRGGQVSLVSFNGLPHLGEPDLHTLV